MAVDDILKKIKADAEEEARRDRRRGQGRGPTSWSREARGRAERAARRNCRAPARQRADEERNRIIDARQAGGAARASQREAGVSSTASSTRRGKSVARRWSTGEYRKLHRGLPRERPPSRATKRSSSTRTRRASTRPSSTEVSTDARPGAALKLSSERRAIGGGFVLRERQSRRRTARSIRSFGTRASGSRPRWPRSCSAEAGDGSERSGRDARVIMADDTRYAYAVARVRGMETGSSTASGSSGCSPRARTARSRRSSDSAFQDAVADVAQPGGHRGRSRPRARRDARRRSPRSLRSPSSSTSSASAWDFRNLKSLMKAAVPQARRTPSRARPMASGRSSTLGTLSSSGRSRRAT